MNRNRHEDEDARRERKVLDGQQRREEIIEPAKSMQILASYLNRNDAHATIANGELNITRPTKTR